MSQEERDRAEEVFEDWVSRCFHGQGETREDLIGANPDLRDQLLQRMQEYDVVLEQWRRGTRGGAGLATGSLSLGEAGKLLTPGGRLGKYHLEREIGQGGMGTVWLAHDPWLNRHVALKFLPQEFVKDRLAMRQLRDEAKVMLSLTHPSIVRLHTFDAMSGLVFLVEEYLPGGSLVDALDGRNLSADEALWLLDEIAPALDYAHGLGITHRDVKPGNLLLTEALTGPLGQGAERVKVGDFGLAFVASSMMSVRSNYNPSGTLPYMSPEVLMGRKPSSAADIYSVGVTIFEMVTGQLPFHSGDIPTQIRYRIAPPLTSGDPALDAAVAKALSKNPADRPGTLAELARLARAQQAARPVVREKLGPTIRERKRPRRTTRAGTIAKLLAIGVAVTIFTLIARDRSQQRPEERATLATPDAPEIRVDAAQLQNGQLYIAEGGLVLRGTVVHARGGGIHVKLEGEAEATFVPFAPSAGNEEMRAFTIERPMASSGSLLVRSDGADPVRVPVVVDPLPPTIEDLGPEGDSYSEEIQIRVRVSDANLVAVTLDGQPMVEEEPSVFTGGPVGLMAGSDAAFTVRAEDRAGNAGDLRLTRRLVPKTAVLASPRPGTLVSRWKPMSVELAFDPPVAAFELGDQEVHLDPDGQLGTVHLRPPDDGESWVLLGVGADLGGRTVETELRYAIHEPLSVLPDRFRIVDSTPGALGYPREIELSSVPGLRLRLLEPGVFTMGASAGGNPWERGSCVVTIEQPLYMQTHEVTVSQFHNWAYPDNVETVTSMKLGGIRRPCDSGIWERAPEVDYLSPMVKSCFAYDGSTARAVTQVSYWDALAFCRSYGLRLPTEAEWEYAARAGTDEAWWRAASEGPAENLADSSLERIAAEKGIAVLRSKQHDDKFPFTARVGSFRPNPWGFHDMMGNVREWTMDVFDPWALTRGLATDPCLRAQRPEGASPAEARVIRGEDWCSEPEETAVTKRYFEPAESTLDYVGFRVVFDPVGRHELTEPETGDEVSSPRTVKLARYGADGSPATAWVSPRRLRGYLEFPADTQPVPSTLASSAVEVLSGTWHVEGDELVQTERGKGEKIIAFGDPEWSEYDLTVEGLIVEGGLSGLNALFHVRDLDNFGKFSIGCYAENKWAEVCRRLDGERFRPEADAREDPIEYDEWYELRIEVRGENVKCFRDGDQLFDSTDEALTFGRAGLGCWDGEVRFRNLVVTHPEGSVLLSGISELFEVPDAAESESEEVELVPEEVTAPTRKKARASRPRLTGPEAQAVERALVWLQAHQSEDGYWDCDNFMDNNVMGGSDCDGGGSAAHDVGVTGLALLAFLGDGHTMSDGQYQAVVSKGVKWLRDQQDPDNGQIGERLSLEFLYDHGIATLALCEAYYLSGKSPVLKSSCQKAVNFIQTARNPYAAWRYEVPPNSENDSSITGWMVLALSSAREAGLVVDPGAFDGAKAFFEEVTKASGRTGYMLLGQGSSRIPGVNDHFPVDKTETMTAVSLLCRLLIGESPKHELEQQADLVTGKLPQWHDDGLTNDMYYWYYGTSALRAYGGEHWKKWKAVMREAVTTQQVKAGDSNGSWDPIGPWGHAGGRVYSTAICALTLLASR